MDGSTGHSNSSGKHMFKAKKKSKAHDKGEKALKGLKAAGSAAPSHSPAKGKATPPVDPTKGLREAIKAKEIEALAMQAASGL
jgi:hypothetical protein